MTYGTTELFVIPGEFCLIRSTDTSRMTLDAVNWQANSFFGPHSLRDPFGDFVDQ